MADKLVIIDIGLVEEIRQWMEDYNSNDDAKCDVYKLSAQAFKIFRDKLYAKQLRVKKEERDDDVVEVSIESE